MKNFAGAIAHDFALAKCIPDGIAFISIFAGDYRYHFISIGDGVRKPTGRLAILNNSQAHQKLSFFTSKIIFYSL